MVAPFALGYYAYVREPRIFNYGSNYSSYSKYNCGSNYNYSSYPKNNYSSNTRAMVALPNRQPVLLRRHNLFGSAALASLWNQLMPRTIIYVKTFERVYVADM